MLCSSYAPSTRYLEYSSIAVYWYSFNPGVAMQLRGTTFTSICTRSPGRFICSYGFGLYFFAFSFFAAISPSRRITRHRLSTQRVYPRARIRAHSSTIPSFGLRRRMSRISFSSCWVCSRGWLCGRLDWHRSDSMLPSYRFFQK